MRTYHDLSNEQRYHRKGRSPGRVSRLLGSAFLSASMIFGGVASLKAQEPQKQELCGNTKDYYATGKKVTLKASAGGKMIGCLVQKTDDSDQSRFIVKIRNPDEYTVEFLPFVPRKDFRKYRTNLFHL